MDQTVSGKGDSSLRVMSATARFFSLLIDCLVVAALGRISPFSLLNGERLPQTLDGWISNTLWVEEAFMFLIAFLGALACWGAVFEGVLGWTPGKRLLGGRVLNRFGDRIGLFRAMVRNGLKVLFLTALGLGQLWAFFDVERRSVYDRMTGVVVARGLPKKKT